MEKEQLEKFKGESAEENINSSAEKQNKVKKCCGAVKNLFTKRIVIIAIVLIVIATTGVILRKTVFKPAPKKIYEVAVMVRSQENPNKAEDMRTSLKVGDALVIQKDGHNWSRIEKISYLILKMNLTEEQKAKLTQGEEREISEDELSQEEMDRIAEEKKRAEENDEKYMEEPRTETIRARQYHIDMEIFEGFKANDLLNKQPYYGEVYDWGIVDKKKAVK